MYKKSVLPSDIRVVSHKMKERKSIGLGFLVGVGGRYEDDSIKGAAHFLEHILFKGSKKYSCNAIKEKIEGVGGSLNAFTSEEKTCYYAKIPSKFLKSTFDILSDMVYQPLISRKDVLRESTVIIEEIKMYNDLPQFFVLELLEKLLWPGHPLGKNLAGTVQTVAGMSEKDLRKFHRDYYNPKNIIVSACGDLKHDDLVGLVKQKAAGISSKKKRDFIKAKSTQANAKSKFYRKDIEQMHIALGMFGLEVTNKDRYALNLMNIILGGNMSSRLFNEVREKRGLAYSISSASKSLKDTGVFLVRAGVDNKKVVEAVDVILQELKKIRKNGVTKDEFKRAKDFYLGQVLLGLEDTLDHMLWLGESVSSFGKIITLEEVVNKINKINMLDIKRVANEVLREERLNLAIVGPLKDVQEKRLRALLKS